MYKNIFIASVVSLVLIVGASQPVQALTTEDLQIQIQRLMAQITDLTAQLNALRGQSSVSSTMPAMPVETIANHRICVLAARSLAQGASGEDVRALQEFLQSENVFSGTPTGYFGPVTSLALTRWQASQGIDAAGVVGPKTLEKIKIKCGMGNANAMRFTVSPSRGDAPLTATFSTWISGFRIASTYYTIDFGDGTSERAADCPAPADACTGPGQNFHTYSQNGTYTATLNKITDPCMGNPICKAAIHSEIVGKVQVVVGGGGIACTKEYMPVCGAKPIYCITTPCNPIPTTYSNKCMMAADGASLLYEGQCRDTSENPANNPQCKAWFDGCNSCARNNPGEAAACTLKYCAVPQKPYCTAYFDTTSNKAPSISSFSGPTTLLEDTSGTWTIEAKDPEGGTLSYQIWWGDEGAYGASNAASSPAQRDFVQSTTFAHTYYNPGTYTVTILVTDSAGLSAKSSMSVKVTGTQTVCADIYQPVCSRPTGCANTCAPGMVCPAICQLYSPQTYSNRCYADRAGAQYLHDGECTSTSGNYY